MIEKSLRIYFSRSERAQTAERKCGSRSKVAARFSTRWCFMLERFAYSSLVVFQFSSANNFEHAASSKAVPLCHQTSNLEFLNQGQGRGTYVMRSKNSLAQSPTARRANPVTRARMKFCSSLRTPATARPRRARAASWTRRTDAGSGSRSLIVTARRATHKRRFSRGVRKH